MMVSTWPRRHLIGLGAALLACPEAAWAKPRTISEHGFVSIGGIDQWIGVDGEDARNPVILYLHGGPAEAQSPFLNQFTPWLHDFTVVNWDQRGAGKTYGRNGAATPDITLDRMVDDTIEVALYARKRLSKKRVILVGQSWGAILGLNAIKRRPDLFAAFVGTGQPVTWASSLAASERWARQQATAAGDQASLATLDAAAALPASDFRRLAASAKYRMTASDLNYLAIQRAFVGSTPGAATGDAADWAAGGSFSVPKLLSAIASFDAYKLGLDMPVPIFVIQGRDDHVTSFDAARDYIDALHAPKKAFVPIEGGHFALFTNPTEFVAALRKYARPLA